MGSPVERRRLGRFGRNILSNAGGNALISVLQLVLLCALFRILDDASYAAFLTVGYLIGLLEIASDYGGRLWAIREFSVSETPRRVLSRSLRSKLFYTLVSAAILSLLPLNTLTFHGFVLSVLIAATQPGTDPLLWFLRGRERLDVEAVVVLSSRITVVAGMAVAAFAGLGLTSLLTIWLLGNLLRLAVEARLAITQPLFARQAGNPDRAGSSLQNIAAVFPLGTALILTCMFQRCSLYLMESYADVQDYNIYATAFKFVNTSGAIATAIFVASFARLTKAVESQDTAAIRAVIHRKLMLVTAVFVPACVLGILLIVPLSAMFESNNVRDVGGVMVLLMPGLYLCCVNMGLKYTLNAYALNWHDVAAVVVGTAALCLVTVFHGNLSWWSAGALGWFAGESTLLASRLGLLWSQKKHRGVPVGVICGSAAALLLMVALRR